MATCPCGSKKAYDECCGLFLKGKAIPKTPEQLMRSRFTAFVNADVDYIEKTMRGRAIKDFDKADTKEWAQQCTWKTLNILHSSIDEKDPNTGYVEFIVDYEQGKKPLQIHEKSVFHRENGHWYYVDGEMVADKVTTQHSTKIGRNEPCPCGSGKKSKKCCGK